MRPEGNVELNGASAHTWDGERFSVNLHRKAD
jgi:hypothetical protein